MNIIEQIKAEIERLIVKHELEYTTAGYVMNELLSFLSTLELENPLGLEEEIHKYNKERFDEYFPEQDGDFISEVDFMTCLDRVARHFAKWQKEQDEISKVNYEGARAVYDNTVQHLQKKIDEKYELGKKDMKEQMLKEAVEGVLVDNVDGTQEICLHGNRYGEKVRIIIVKED